MDFFTTVAIHFFLLRMLNCEAHRCQQLCHRFQCQPCPRSPSLVRTCACTQTPLTKLMELGYAERQSCSDPIPSCGKACGKPLACGSSGEEEGMKCTCRVYVEASSDQIQRQNVKTSDGSGSCELWRFLVAKQLLRLLHLLLLFNQITLLNVFLFK